MSLGSQINQEILPNSQSSESWPLVLKDVDRWLVPFTRICEVLDELYVLMGEKEQRRVMVTYKIYC